MLLRSSQASLHHRRCCSPLPTLGRPVRASCRPTMSAAAAAPQPVLGAGSAEPPAGPDAQHPLFLTTWSCPYAQRSWIALNAKGIDHTPVFVDLNNKPEWFFKHNEYGRVPTLVWEEGGETKSLYESLIVNEYVADLPGGAPLLPADPAGRAAARLLIDQFGAKFGAAFGRVMFAADAEAATPAAVDLAAALRWLEGRASAEGPFLLGRDFSLADAAIVPFFLRLELLQRLGTFTVPDDLPKLEAWQAACLAHPAVARSMQPPDAGRPYLDQLLDNYKEFIAKRRAAAAAQ